MCIHCGKSNCWDDHNCQNLPWKLQAAYDEGRNNAVLFEKTHKILGIHESMTCPKLLPKTKEESPLTAAYNRGYNQELAQISQTSIRPAFNYNIPEEKISIDEQIRNMTNSILKRH